MSGSLKPYFYFVFRASAAANGLQQRVKALCVVLDGEYTCQDFAFRTKEPLNKSSSAGRRIFCPTRAVLKAGNTYSIPPLSELSSEAKSSAASSCRFNQSFPKDDAVVLVLGNVNSHTNHDEYLRYVYLMLGPQDTLLL